MGKPRLDCPECGPQGGHGWIDLARFRYPCSICWAGHEASYRVSLGADFVRMTGGFGSWDVELRRNRYDFFGDDYHGTRFIPAPNVLAEWRADGAGKVVARFKIPTDLG